MPLATMRSRSRTCARRISPARSSRGIFQLGLHRTAWLQPRWLKNGLRSGRPRPQSLFENSMHACGCTALRPMPVSIQSAPAIRPGALASLREAVTLRERAARRPDCRAHRPPQARRSSEAGRRTRQRGREHHSQRCRGSNGVDLIVRGAYGHSHFRQFGLGGATMPKGMTTLS